MAKKNEQTNGSAKKELIVTRLFVPPGELRFKAWIELSRLLPGGAPRILLIRFVNWTRDPVASFVLI